MEWLQIDRQVCASMHASLCIFYFFLSAFHFPWTRGHTVYLFIIWLWRTNRYLSVSVQAHLAPCAGYYDSIAEHLSCRKQHSAQLCPSGRGDDNALLKYDTLLWHSTPTTYIPLYIKTWYLSLAPTFFVLVIWCCLILWYRIWSTLVYAASTFKKDGTLGHFLPAFSVN